MRRREFLGALGGAAAMPFAAIAQEGSRRALIGWLDGQDENDSVARSLRSAMREGLAKLGWIEGRNLRIELRFGASDANRMRDAASELVHLSPNIIIAGGASPARAAKEATQKIPIVFTGGGDATAIGLVKTIGRPEGNITGFSNSEPSIGGKWLELLKAAAPHLTRVAIVFNPDVGPTAPRYIASAEAAAQRHAVQTVKVPFHNAVELVRSIDVFAIEPNGGLMLLPPSPLRPTVLQLAAQHRLPAIYSNRAIAFDGGLLSYSTDTVEQHPSAAAYVDRILRGTKIADLPVQWPTKYQLAVNLRTAKAIGLTISEAFLLQADELIE
jgi:putative tryptophan/tyrosine transport system substrate-binding protein